MDSFHLIGIKGTGMAALAMILKDMGYTVTGSDVDTFFFTEDKLKAKEINILNFSEDNITKGKIYIASSVYQDDNIEVKKVKENNYPFFYYHQFIEFFFKNKIGISGTHGKTTTTSLIAHLFNNQKIAYLIGDGSGGGMKDYDYFIFEACEYKNHFLSYNFDFLVINNIDYDHPDFFNSIFDVIESFKKATKNAKQIIVNIDDENIKHIKHENKFTFGFSSEADVVCKILNEYKSGYTISVKIKNDEYQYYLPFAGKFMIYNFLAALSVYYLCGFDLSLVQDLLLTYQKPSRRMQEFMYYDNVIIDDYAHHPKEIKACFEGIKQKYPNKELIVIFQPHTYSRTIHLEKEFKEVFSGVNLYLAKTFTSKRESYNKQLEKKIFKMFENAKPFKEKDLKTFKKMNNKVILFLGAGNIDRYIKNIIGM